jgi:outer membrane protein assembly factor BamB
MDELDISLTSPAVAEDIVYFSYVENYWSYGGIACINVADGEVIWDKRLNYDFFTVSTPAIADGKLFIGGMNLREVASFINCYDIDTGSQIWRNQIGELSMVDTSPAIVDGKTFIASYSGTIFAFKDNTPPNAPVINGPNKGNPEMEIGFTLSSRDFDGDDIAEFVINWGDNVSDEIVTGPFLSGEKVIVSHIWADKGTYLIKAKAKDLFGDESNWSEFEISIPRTKTTSFLWLEWLFERFTILEKLLDLII